VLVGNIGLDIKVLLVACFLPYRYLNISIPQNLSFYLGGKARSDPERWKPDMRAVRETIKYALATGRLDRERDGEQEQEGDQSQ
jgi:hypothetical protein